MKISNDVKLDFEDVLLTPARSTTSSRKDVELYRPFKFYHSKKEWHGVPFMAANMPHTGNVKMAQALLKHSMVTCLHKYHTHEQLESFYSYFDIAPFAWVSIGMCHDDILKIEKYMKNVESEKKIIKEREELNSKSFDPVPQDSPKFRDKRKKSKKTINNLVSKKKKPKKKNKAISPKRFSDPVNAQERESNDKFIEQNNN